MIRRPRQTGLSLVEMLIVIAIIAVISAVAVPILARSGLFVSSEVDLAGRELFALLKAAKVYAGTHNVESAVVYAGQIVRDTTMDDADMPFVPSVDRFAAARRLNRSELAAIGQRPDAEVFVFLGGRDGRWRELPNRAAVLPDLFQVEDEGGPTDDSITALNSILIWDPAGGFLTPREPYLGVTDRWPAHVFSPAGSLVPEGFFPAQRVEVRVGLSPDQLAEDRFYLPVEDTNAIQIPVYFNTPMMLRRLIDPETGEPATNDVVIELYVAPGRVRIQP